MDLPFPVLAVSFERTCDGMELSVLGDDGDRALETAGRLLGEIPESGIKERLSVVQYDNGIHAVAVRHQPLGPCF